MARAVKRAHYRIEFQGCFMKSYYAPVSHDAPDRTLILIRPLYCVKSAQTGATLSVGHFNSPDLHRMVSVWETVYPMMGV
jgi:hypothetical protein